MAETETDKRPEEAEAPPADDVTAQDAPAAEAEEHPSLPVAPVAPGVAAKYPSSIPAAEAITTHRSSMPVAAASERVKLEAPAPREVPNGGPLAAYEAVARSARLPDLVSIAQKILGEASTARPTGGWDYAAKVSAAADDAKLSRSDADTPFGNALKVLGSGPEGEAERALACALWAHAIAEARRDDEDRLAGDVLWLATHTPFDATSLLDRALGEEADELWSAVGDHVRRIDDGRGTSLGRGEAILGCAALTASDSAAARKVALDLTARLRDPTLVRLLAATAEAPLREVRLEGEAVAAPRGPVLTAVLALTGILFVVHAVRLVARLALAYRRPAEIVLSETGVRMRSRTELLGRTLREREHVIVRAGLVRIVREVRYPRAAFYAGLLALALGSYIGVRAFVDGVRAASPSLLVMGIVVIAVGIGADFVLGSLLPGARGKVRILFVPRTGASLCVAEVDAARADEALARALAPR